MQMELARVPSEISASCTSYVAKCKSVFTVFACADVCVSKSDVLKLRLLNIMLQAVVYLHVCETEYLYKLGKLPYKVSSRSKDSYKCWVRREYFWLFHVTICIVPQHALDKTHIQALTKSNI